ncbi:MAG: transcription-repair coupling factor [Bacteroidia bacterium]
MEIGKILELYTHHPAVKKLSENYSEQVSYFHLRGAVGSSKSFIAAAAFKQSNHHFLFILNDKEEAAYFLNDLETLLPESSVLFYPTSYKKPYEPLETDNANILLRAEVLNTINQSNKPLCIVSYPDALSEKVVTRQHLEKNTLKLNIGEKVSIDFLNDLFQEYGFQLVDYVLEPGQYSIRGGIIDVFSFSDDYPYRIELFGDDVDSIRSFDPVSQLSIKTLQHISIIPNVQKKLVEEHRTSFLEYLHHNTLIWIQDIQLCCDRLDKAYELAEKAYVQTSKEIKHLEPKELFISSEFFKKHLLEKSVVEFGQQCILQPAQTLLFQTTPQPTFNKNFELLLENLQQNKTANFTTYIFADNNKQAERLKTIFNDIAPNKNADGDLFQIIISTLHEGFIDKELKIACYTDHQIFERYQRFRLKDIGFKKNEAITLKELYGLNPGDYVTHIDHGIGRFGGLEKIEVNGKIQEAIRLIYKDNDILYVSIHSLHRISKYTGKEGTQPKLNKLGSNTWSNLKQKTKARVKTLAFDLVKLYAKRKSMKGFAFSPDTYLQNELEASFIYEDTPDQEKATNDVKRDMESPAPMDRLICGDVGFGKTEIAIRAAFKAVCDNKQVAVLVPTTILALQHYKTFSERLKGFPCNVDYINRFKTAKQQKETLKKLEEGKIDIIIATHRLVGKDIKFKDLGLLIIDEEQKFGVNVKDKLKLLKTNVDTLTLTATPIPRTLQFSLMGARDLSVINTPPPNRQPVHTELHSFNEELIRDAISYELQRGGQVFFIHNRVQNLPELAGMIQRLVPDARVAFAHGQMDGEKLEDIMMQFVEGYFDVLVATTIIESGLDIPNANTIIINDAHMFGLSDLHQMRGRVGRSNKKAFCYLLSPPLSVLTPEARKRLQAIEQFSDIGSGFHIAMRDLDIRGAGDLLGAEQSGFISDIGYDMYMKILQEAMQELKDEMRKEYEAKSEQEKAETEFVLPESMNNASFVNECVIETDMEILIPDEYVSNITERLHLYKELDNLEKEEAIINFEEKLKDRFGPVPQPTLELMNIVRLRIIAKQIGLEKIVLKSNKLIGYFISNQESPFYQSDAFNKVLHYVQKNSRACKMKEQNNKLSIVFEQVDSVSKALDLIKTMHEFEPIQI